MIKNLGVLAAAVGSLAVAGVVHANTYTFSFFGDGYTASGTLTGTLDSPLTGITGTINGDAITGLSNYGLTATPPLGDVLYSAAPHVPYNGIAFDTASDSYNLYYNNIPNDGAPFGFYVIQESLDPVPNAPNAPFGTPVTFTSSVPEPATWAMMIVGIGFAGASLRRRAANAVHA